MSGLVRLCSRTGTLDAAPERALRALPGGRGYAWIRDGIGSVAWGVAVAADVAPGPDRFARAGQIVQAVVAAEPDGRVPTAFVSFPFAHDAPGSRVVFPAVRIAVERDAVELTVWGRDAASLRQEWDDAARAVAAAPDESGHDRIRYAGASRTEMQWLEAAAALIRRIEGGELEKVVLARDVHVWSRSPFDLAVLAKRLATRFPSCFTYIFEGLVGASPELLVRTRGTSIQSLVLAGSAPRGSDLHADDIAANRLRRSPKEQREHELAVASVTEPLKRLSGRVTMSQPSLLVLSNVQHLSTSVTAELDAPRSALEVAGLLHPTAAVAGTPRPAALEAIARSEGLDRSRYAGVVGTVTAGGDGELAIALRCGEFEDGRGRLFAGAGLVAGSAPEAELEETRVKLRAMEAALEGTSPRI